MKIIETGFEDLWIIQPAVFKDDRGYFFESYNKEKFKELTGLNVEFIQDNQSKSNYGVLRGLHFQAPPHAQDKLVRVTTGGVLDIVVDIRKDSKTFGKSFSIELTEDNFTMLFVPKGFAHGFKTLVDNTVFNYKCSNLYNKPSEGCILWNDKDLNIDWNIANPTLSEKDKEGTLFKDFISPF